MERSTLCDVRISFWILNLSVPIMSPLNCMVHFQVFVVRPPSPNPGVMAASYSPTNRTWRQSPVSLIATPPPGEDTPAVPSVAGGFGRTPGFLWKPNLLWKPNPLSHSLIQCGASG